MELILTKAKTTSQKWRRFTGKGVEVYLDRTEFADAPETLVVTPQMETETETHVPSQEEVIATLPPREQEIARIIQQPPEEPETEVSSAHPKRRRKGSKNRELAGASK